MSEQEWLEEFSDNLQAMIREAGISQKELANISGISTSDISRYINGQQQPSAKAVVKLAYALECNTDDLIDFGETIED